MQKFVLSYFESKYCENVFVTFSAASLESAEKEFKEAQDAGEYGNFKFRGASFDGDDIHFSIQTLENFFEHYRIDKNL